MHRLKPYSILLLLGWLVTGLLAGCVQTPSAERRLAANESVITITLLQLNDIYEIDGVGGGKAGGLDRVAALRQQLLTQNPHTFTVLAGDLFSPSAIGTAKVNGKRLDGEQMVDVLNAMGLDLATFGNHEFDLQEGPFRDRLRESHFTWITSNVSDASGQLFPKTLSHKILTVNDAAGTVRIGLVGATVELGQETVQLVPCNPGGEAPVKARYYRIHDPIESIRQQVAALGPVDVLIALTHLNLEEDMRLAKAVPQLDLILGGHEHENWHVQRGPHFTPILKADANARTVYIHTLRYDTPTRRLDVTSQLKTITAQTPSDAAVKARIEAWTHKAFDAFRAQNLNPQEEVANLTETLDGREASVRQGETNLTRLIADAMLRQAAGTELAVYNSGSIRIDDELPPGPVTQYDVIRILPFGGELWDVEIRGDVLDCVLRQGRANRGSGGFLQTANVTTDRQQDSWLIKGQNLDKSRFYRVAINDFLLSGREKGLAFLTLEYPGIKKSSKRIVSHDLRQVLIQQLRQQYGGQ